MIRRWLFLPLALAGFALPLTVAAQDAFTNRTTNVRAGPDVSYPVVAQLGPGLAVEVMGCVEDYTWCDVVFADNRGWIAAANLDYPWQSRRVPILGYGAAIGLPIVVFSVGNYWDRYYRGRPWYNRRDYWSSRPQPYHARPFERPNRPRQDLDNRPNRPRQDYDNRPNRTRQDENRFNRPRQDENRPNRPRQESDNRPRPGTDNRQDRSSGQGNVPDGNRPQPAAPEGRLERPRNEQQGGERPAPGPRPEGQPSSGGAPPGRGGDARPQPRESGRPGGQPRAQ